MTTLPSHRPRRVVLSAALLVGCVLTCAAASPALAQRAAGEAAVAERNEPAAKPKNEKKTDDAADGAEKAGPTAVPGRVLRLRSPIDERSLARVRNVATELLGMADGTQRPVLILEVPTGSSAYHNVCPLAKFLTSAQVSALRTVAWIPDTVTGHNAIIALACDEIVMHPDAEFGDVGRGEPLPDDQRDFILGLVSKQNNRLVPTALAVGLVDPAEAVLKVKLDDESGEQTTRLVTRAELDRLRQADVTIRGVETVKEAGAPGLFSGAQARREGLLAARTATAVAEVVAAYGLPIEAAAGTSGGEVGKVRKIVVEGVIDELLESFLERQIDRAASSGADLIIFEITSPGGLLYVSQQLAEKIADLDDYNGRDIRTVAWIPREAYSGGTMVALGCDEIYLTPTAQMGDAAPIEMRPGQAFERAPEKILSPTIGVFQTLAERKGRPKAVIQAMIDKDHKVFEVTHAETGQTWFMGEEEIHEAGGLWIKGRQVPESREGLLLTPNGVRANELKVAGPPMADFTELKAHLGIPAERRVPTMQRTWVDTTVFILNAPGVTVLLFALGILFLILEAQFVTGIFSILAGLCFALFFWSKVLGGTAGSLEVLLFVIGAALIALEIFVIPGLGVFGVTGTLLVIGALVMASQTFQGLSVSESATQVGKTVTQFGLAFFGMLLLASVIGRYLPRVPLFRDLVLAAPGGDTMAPPGVRLSNKVAEAAGGVTVGLAGKAISTLRPAGKARLGEDLVDVVSEGPYIDPGTPVEVVEVQGNRVVVREIV